MNRKHYPLLLLIFVAQVAVAQHQWAWIGGDQSTYSKGIYGTQGVAAPTNIPGSRVGASVWTDNQGDMWLFGGRGNGESADDGYLNDLWKFNSSNNQWTWVGGDKNTNAAGIYGEKGTSSPNNWPGARQNTVTWADNQGNLWMYGGMGVGVDQNGDGLLNDLWKYSTATNQWTWVSGDRQLNQTGMYGKSDNKDGDSGNDGGTGGGNDGDGNRNDGDRDNDDDDSGNGGRGNDDDDDNSNNNNGNNDNNGNGDNDSGDSESKSIFPGGRTMATGWIDNKGNLWFFGGRGLAADAEIRNVNEVWTYSPSENKWKLIHGQSSGFAEAHYSKKGSFSKDNTPGGRRGSTGWTDKEGKFWLFGGAARSDLFSDLWMFDPEKKEWAWIAGSKAPNLNPLFSEIGLPDPQGNPGARMLASGWTDSQGDLWLFGGNGYGGILEPSPLNNLWKYSIAIDAWTFVKGETSVRPTAVYGSKGVAADENNPGGMSNSSAWKDKQGNFWVFGGRSIDGYLNQSWKFSIACVSAIIGSLSPATASICEGGSQVLTASGGTSYEWLRDGVKITGETGATFTATEPGTYTVRVTKGKCTAPASGSSVITLVTAPTGNISPATATICDGGSQLLTATGGTSYEWRRNDVLIAGETKATLTATEPGTYSVIIKNGSCSGPASNTSVISLGTAPTGTISPATAAICEGGVQTLTATGGTSYEWLRDGTTIEGQTGATLTVSSPGTYSAVIKNGNCSGSASNTAVVSLETTSGTRYPNLIVRPNVPAQLAARPVGNSYIWTPATDLDDPTSSAPTVTTNTNREYQVLITIGEGCTLTDTVLVKVSVDTKIFVPTAFTPNGNNVNDRLRPLGNIGTIDYFRIYNRWGALVYQTSEIGAGWDGVYKGVAQPSDTYTWLLVGKTSDGQPIKQSGKTLLIR